MARPPTTAGFPGGFTILELLTVCVILGIMGAIAVPRLLPERMASQQGAQVLVSTLMQAQRLAVSQQRNVIVTFDVDAAVVVVHVDGDHDEVRDSDERVSEVDLGESVLYGLGGASPRTGDSAPVTFSDEIDGNPVVTFHRNGSASAAGAVYLTSPRATAQQARMVALDRATGRTRIMSPVDSGPTWVPVGGS